MTLAQWQAKVIWHIEQAETLIDAMGPDSVAFGSKITAHVRTATAICNAIDSKVIK